MPWQQIKVNTNPTHSEELEQLLMNFGAVSISLIDSEDQPVFQLEPGGTILWDSTTVVALFQQDVNLTPCISALSNHTAVKNKETLAIENIEDQDWERAWMNDFEAMQFGESLWICPSWQTPPDPSAVTIMLDPGLAFGSGTHATTSLCLQWLEQTDLSQKSVIDYGCGSGVLAIASILLGAKNAIGVDNDPQAILATLENSKRNSLDEDQIQAFLPDQHPTTKADILLANILCAPLLDLAELLASLVAKDGHIVLSGILEEQIDLIESKYSTWFDLAPATVKDGWVRINGVLKH
ncbi:MAG: 50S ribosomal protein L11 methyltransferase [Pseudohongiellaceae bacterium]